MLECLFCGNLCLTVSLFLVFVFLNRAWSRMARKTFTKAQPTNILITGGAQGLGKLVAQKFASSFEPGSVNLIVCDIREDLAKDLIADVKKSAGAATFKGIHFYRVNLADANDVESFWATVRREHGDIHILINNAARCIGKRVEDLSLAQVKLTMDINFHSYVHLMILFQKQEGMKKEVGHSRYHLVNVSSIAGHMTCSRNSDYSASKFALNGFVDALR